jgi:O-antigen/teichoic acid export membrane protein
MSSHLARPSSTRPSQDPVQRRLRRLSFKPLAETEGETNGVDEQATLKVPAATLHYVKRRREFLVAPKRPQRKEQQQKPPSTSRDGHEQENKKQPAPPRTKGVEKQPTEKEPASPEIERRQVEQVQTVPLAAPERQKGRLPDTLDASQPDTVILDTLDASQPDTVILENPEARIDDDPQFGQRSTIPMVVLSGIAAQQGKAQSEMKSDVSGAAGAASLMGFGSIIGNILKYVGAFLIQYGFGPGGYGLYTLCLSLVNLISALFNLGLDDAMVRYVAIYRGKQQTKSLRGLLIFCTTLAGLAGIAGALLLLFFAPPLVTYWISLKQHHVANRDTLARSVALLQVMAPLIPLMTMQVMWFAGLRGFRAFKWRVLTTGIIQPSLQIILLGLVLVFFRTKDGITAVAVALFISTMFNTVLNLYFLFREVERVVKPEPEHYEVREWLTFASFNFLTTIIDTVLDSIDTILLARFGLSDVAIGQYGAAIRLGNFIAMPLLSINNVFAPTIAELHSKGEMQKLESMFKLLTKWTVMFSLPIFLVMVLFSPYLLALPGPDFVPAWPLLIAFSTGGMINAGTGAVGYMLLMTGYQRLSFLNSLVAVVVNISLGIILTPRYGAMGTAISTGLAICALNFMRLLQVRIVLKMHPYNREVLKPIAAGAISAALIGGALYLLRVGHIHSALHIGHAVISIQLLLIPIFFVGYIVLITRFKASPEDEFVLKGLRKKFLGGNKNKKKVKER